MVQSTASPPQPPQRLTFLDTTVALLSLAAQDTLRQVPELDSVTVIFGWRPTIRSGLTPGLSFGRGGELNTGRPGEVFSALEQTAKVLGRLSELANAAVRAVHEHGEALARDVHAATLQLKQLEHDIAQKGQKQE